MMATTEMHIHKPITDAPIAEAEIYHRLLPLDGARIVELGCGTAGHTRAIAESGRPAAILACEVDTIQHERNLAIRDLPTVRFLHGGAEAIPTDDAGTDIVMMFKSLHHVPMHLMDNAMREIRRVLRPGGLAYISEPVYAGEFNEILRLFNDEKSVREAAFASVCRAVEQGVLELAGQHFFHTESRFADFAEFERRILGATHSNFDLGPELLQTVRERFEAHVGPEGARFVVPIRVDLLRRGAD